MGMIEELPSLPLAQLRARHSAKWRLYPADVLPLTVAELDFALARPGGRGVAPGSGPVGHRVLAGQARSRTGARRLRGQAVGLGARPVGGDVGRGRRESAWSELLRVLTRPGERVVISPPVYRPFFHWAPEARTELLEVPLTSGLSA